MDNIRPPSQPPVKSGPLQHRWTEEFRPLRDSNGTQFPKQPQPTRHLSLCTSSVHLLAQQGGSIMSGCPGRCQPINSGVPEPTSPCRKYVAVEDNKEGGEQAAAFSIRKPRESSDHVLQGIEEDRGNDVEDKNFPMEAM